jgi:hypothetical protein
MSTTRKLLTSHYSITPQLPYNQRATTAENRHNYLPYSYQVRVKVHEISTQVHVNYSSTTPQQLLQLRMARIPCRTHEQCVLTEF